MPHVISMCVWGDHDPMVHAKKGYAPIGVYNLIDQHGEEKFFTIYFPLDFSKKIGASRLAYLIGETITKELLFVKANFH